MNYAVELVPLLQLEEMKKRHLENERNGPGRRSTELLIGVNDKESDPEKRDVQRPRAFYRRDADSNPLMLKKFFCRVPGLVPGISKILIRRMIMLVQYQHSLHTRQFTICELTR